MFNMAVKWGKAQKNPVSEVKLFKEPEGKDRILSPEEEARFFDAIQSHKQAGHLEPVIIMALATGMRRSELLNLKWPNVDFASRVITVGGTKNGNIRKIPMNSRLTEVLSNAKKVSQGEYVFPNKKGVPYKNLRISLNHALKAANIEGVTLHSLHHTFGSRLGMMGTDLGTIQELMGHADLKMTKRYYHPTIAHKREAVEMLSQVTTTFTTDSKMEKSQEVVSIDKR